MLRVRRLWNIQQNNFPSCFWYSSKCSSLAKKQKKKRQFGDQTHPVSYLFHVSFGICCNTLCCSVDGGLSPFAASSMWYSAEMQPSVEPGWKEPHSIQSCSPCKSDEEQCVLQRIYTWSWLPPPRWDEDGCSPNTPLLLFIANYGVLPPFWSLQSGNVSFPLGKLYGKQNKTFWGVVLVGYQSGRKVANGTLEEKPEESPHHQLHGSLLQKGTWALWV